MNNKLSLAVLLLILPFICATPKRRREIGKCSYLGDPHLLPFPTAPGQVVNQYLCQPTADEILVQNSLIQIKVTSDPAYDYVISNYTVTIKPAAGYPKKCVISNSLSYPSNSISCPATSAATVTVCDHVLYIQHKNRNISIIIEYYGWYFNVEVNQPFNLITKSTGVCVQWDCPLEIDYVNGRKRRDDAASADAVAICDAFVSTAAKQAGSAADPSIIQSRHDACVYDVTVTGNVEFARGATNSILRSSIEQYEDESGYVKRLKKANVDGKKSFCKTATVANTIIAKSANRCSAKSKKKRCLQTVNTAKLCN